jgi:uncharacterized protein
LLEVERLLDTRLVYGSYPEVVNNPRRGEGSIGGNYFISERLNSNHYDRKFVNAYFWRSHDRAEIDYIEEADGILHAYEFKWKDQKVRFPASFLQAYPEHETSVISRSNFEAFIGLR